MVLFKSQTHLAVSG